ncbi:MAG: 4Fe-4S single cluster domain-containing protein [Sumerlaeia bacterium]
MERSFPQPNPSGCAAESVVNVAEWLPCTEAEGPGRRFALWVQGCPLRCPGCCNPHMLEFRPERAMAVPALEAEVAAARDRDGIEGVTLIGGEPFAQARALAELARRVRAAGLSVMAFSGFPYQTLASGRGEGWAALLAETDLLVAGPYVEALHETDRRWIGSSNQEVHFLTDRYAHLREDAGGWDRGRNSVELRLVGGQVFINGFPHASITRRLEKGRPEKDRNA